MKNLTSLYLVRHDGTTGSYPSNDTALDYAAKDSERGILRLEKKILKGTEYARWKIAYLYQDGTIVHAYNCETGTQRVSKEFAEAKRFEKKEENKPYKVLSIPTLSNQVAGIERSYKFVSSLEEAKKMLVVGLAKIIIYKDGLEIVQYK